MLLKKGVRIVVHYKELYSEFDHPFEYVEDNRLQNGVHAFILTPIWNSIYHATFSTKVACLPNT